MKHPSLFSRLNSESGIYSPRFNTVRRFFSFSFAALLLVVIFSCAGGPKKRAPAILTERSERMFWQIDGVDTAGKPSRVYVLGTLSFGNAELYPLEDGVFAAYSNSAVIAGEIGAKELRSLDEAIPKKMMEGVSLDKKISDVRSFLTEDENALLRRILSAPLVESLSLYEPWALTSLVHKSLADALPYKTSYGVDLFFMNKAAGDKKMFVGLDSLETQLDLLAFGSYEDQLFLLKKKLSAYKNTGEESAVQKARFEAYKTGSRKEFAELFDEAFKNENAQSPVLASYNKLSRDVRNKNWAAKLDEFLQKGGETFVFADTFHFVGKQSVFDYMEAAGTLLRNE